MAFQETVVMVELQGIMENDFLRQVNQAKILGINTEKPLLQLDDYTFTGEYQDTMGTCMLFQEKPQLEGKDEKKLEYAGLTNKKLSLQRVFLKSTAEQADKAETSGVSAKGPSKTTDKESENRPDSATQMSQTSQSSQENT